MQHELLRGTIIADASYCQKSKAAGWATWISADLGIKIRKAGTLKGSPRNSTEAELKALLIGVWYAYKHGIRQMLVQTDCMAAVDAFNGKPHDGQAGLREMIADAKREHFPDAEIVARHVKGHTTNEDARSWVNRWRDYHAGRHMRVERTKRLGPRKPRRPRQKPAAETEYLIHVRDGRRSHGVL